MVPFHLTGGGVSGFWYGRHTGVCAHCVACYSSTYLCMFCRRQPLDKVIGEKGTHAHHSPLHKGERQSVRVSPDRRYSSETCGTRSDTFTRPPSLILYVSNRSFAAAENPRAITRVISNLFFHFIKSPFDILDIGGDLGCLKQNKK